MRTSVGAYALIRRRAAGGAEEWLSNWNEGWKALNLVGGHKENDESFRECCTREIVEELGLDAAADFRVAPEPEARLEYVADSRSSGEKTAYTLELFAVDLLTDAARTRIDADAAACWLTEREIRALRTADGRRAVSPTVEYVLIQAGLLPKQERYDLFVSYAHDDDKDGFVTALANAIQEEHQAFTREPLRIFFDRHDIPTGADWERRILGGLKAARVLLSVLSPTYFNPQRWCLRELETFLDLEKARAWPGEPLTPVYAVTVPDADPARTAEGQAWLRSILQKQFCDLLAWRPHGAAAFRNDEVRRRLKALNERLYERVRRVEQVVRSPSTGPRHNPNFVGREDELRRLREALAAQQVAAITAVHGIGGVGKSALAAEYAHVFGDEYPGGRFWLPAENHDDLRDLFRALEAPLNLTFTDDERKDRDAGYRRVRAELERRPGTLLVLDNVNRPALLAPAHLGAYRPDADRVHVLVTMREEPPADPAGVVRPLPLDQLSSRRRPQATATLPRLRRRRKRMAGGAADRVGPRRPRPEPGGGRRLRVAAQPDGAGIRIYRVSGVDGAEGIAGRAGRRLPRRQGAAEPERGDDGEPAAGADAGRPVGTGTPCSGIRLAAAGGMGGAAVAEGVGRGRVPRRSDARRTLGRRSVAGDRDPAARLAAVQRDEDGRDCAGTSRGPGRRLWADGRGGRRSSGAPGRIRPETRGVSHGRLGGPGSPLGDRTAPAAGDASA